MGCGCKKRSGGGAASTPKLRTAPKQIVKKTPITPSKRIIKKKGI